MNNTLLTQCNIADKGLSFGMIPILIALASLIVVLFTLWQDISARKLKIFHDVRKEFLGIAYKIKSGLQESENKLWDHELLNCADYIGFLARKRKIKYSYVKEYLGEAIIDCYENILIKYKEPNIYEDLRGLYKKLK